MKEHNPFSLYDFLGYLIPGITVILISYFIKQIREGHKLACIFHQMNFEPKITQWIIIIVISYFIGHILNFLSSITVEKYSYWKYDYPSKYLLKISHGKKYLIGEFHVKIWRLMVGFFILPVVIGDYFFGNKLKFKDFYVKGIDDFLIDSIKSKAEELFKKLSLSKPPGKMRDYDYHRIFSHYIMQKSENVNQKTSNYIALYGYLRCMTLILSLSFWITLFTLFNSIWKYECICTFFKSEYYLIMFLIILFLLSYISFMAFMKFYRRYSLENLMAIVTYNA